MDRKFSVTDLNVDIQLVASVIFEAKVKRK